MVIKKIELIVFVGLILLFGCSRPNKFLEESNKKIQSLAVQDLYCCNDTSQSQYWASFALKYDSGVDSLRFLLLKEWIPKLSKGDTIQIVETIRIEDSSVRFMVLINDLVYVSQFGAFPNFELSKEPIEQVKKRVLHYRKDRYPNFKANCCEITLNSSHIITVMSLCPQQDFIESVTFL